MKVIEAKDKMKEDMMKKGEADIFYDTSRKAFSRGGGKIIVAVMKDQWFIDFNADNWKSIARECLDQIKLVPETMRKNFEDTFAWLDKRPCARKRGLGTPLPFDKEWMIESLSDSTIYMTLYTISHVIKKHGLKRENLTGKFFDYVYSGKGTLKEVSKETKIKEEKELPSGNRYEEVAFILGKLASTDDQATKQRVVNTITVKLKRIHHRLRESIEMKGSK